MTVGKRTVIMGESIFWGRKVGREKYCKGDRVHEDDIVLDYQFEISDEKKALK